MEEKISLKVLNELLSNTTKHKYFVNKETGHTGIGESDYDGSQGEYNEYFKYYKHSEFPVGVFLKETYRTDSYGSNDFLEEVQFVKGKEKTITVFEPIS